MSLAFLTMNVHGQNLSENLMYNLRKFYKILENDCILKLGLHATINRTDSRKTEKIGSDLENICGKSTDFFSNRRSRS